METLQQFLDEFPTVAGAMATAVAFARWDPCFLESITLQDRLCHTCLYMQDVQWNLLVSAHAM